MAESGDAIRKFGKNYAIRMRWYLVDLGNQKQKLDILVTSEFAYVAFKMRVAVASERSRTSLQRYKGSESSGVRWDRRLSIRYTNRK
jgi:hypothetical protein